MSPIYSLVDVETADTIGTYKSERSALRAVTGAIQRYGRYSNAVTSLALLREDGPTEHTCIARGRTLAKRALEVGEHSASMAETISPRT